MVIERSAYCVSLWAFIFLTTQRQNCRKSKFSPNHNMMIFTEWKKSWSMRSELLSFIRVHIHKDGLLNTFSKKVPSYFWQRTNVLDFIAVVIVGSLPCKLSTVFHRGETFAICIWVILDTAFTCKSWKNISKWVKVARHVIQHNWT